MARRAISFPVFKVLPLRFGVTWPKPLTWIVSSALVMEGRGLSNGGGGGELVVITAPGVAAAASTAADALMRPKPNEASAPGSPMSSAVASSKEIIFSADNDGLTVVTNAATQATIGLAKEVPRQEPYGFERSRWSVQILSPGAA